MLQTHADFLLRCIKIALATLKLALHGRDLVFAGIERLFARIKRFDAAIERFFTLVDALLGGANLLQTLFVFRLRLLAKSQCFVLCLNDCFTAQRICLAFCVFHDVVRFFSGALRRGVRKVLRYDEANGDAHDSANNKPDNGFHAFPLSYWVG